MQLFLRHMIKLGTLPRIKVLCLIILAFGATNASAQSHRSVTVPANFLGPSDQDVLGIK